MDIYTTAIAVSILVYIVIGSYAGRGVRNLDDYYVAGRRAPTLLIVGTLVASVMSSTMFLGEAGFAYDTQAGPYVLFPQGAAVGYVLELPSLLNPVIIGGLASLLVTIVVSRMTTVSAAEKVYLAKLHERPESEFGQRRTRITLIAPAVLIVVNGVVLPVLLTLYYVLPYQRATGILAPGGSLDWATGEMALMVSWSVIWIALGVFAIRYILRAYAPASRGPSGRAPAIFGRL